MLLEAHAPVLMIPESIQEAPHFCLTRAITRTMIGPCFTPLSLTLRDSEVQAL